MERQQLLKPRELRSRRAPPRAAPARRRRGAFRTLLAGLFARVPLACSLLLACVVLLDSAGAPGAHATPVVSEKQLSTFHLIPSARNIRHLPCISRRTKEEGICMFAIDCLKANGTHLGTCIDRFYFGSCCQIPDYIDATNDNNVEDNTIFGQAIKKPIESIKHDQASASPTSILTQKPTVSLKTQSTASGTTHYITKKPSTTMFHGISSVRYSTTATTKKPIEPALDRTDVSDKTQILPVMKPSRFNYTTTTRYNYETSTDKPSNPTKQPNVTTASTIQSTIYINNQLYNATKPAFVNNQKLSSKPESFTEIPMKISTFQTVQGSQESTKATTQKTTTKKTSSPQKPESQLPFGTRLPSTTASPQKPTTIYTKPGYTKLNQTTRPSSTYTSTYSSTLSQKPFKPTVALRPIPEKPIANATKPSVTQRPIVQRPINSTLSNRRTTTKPTTVLVKRPTETTTQKPTTAAFKPSSSQKPPSRPNTTAHKPTSTKPTKITPTTQKITSTTQKIIHKTETTTTPPRITTNATIFSNKTTTKPTEQPIKKPAIQTTAKPVQKPTTSNYNATSIATTTSKPTIITKKPTLKPTVQVTHKPLIKPITTTVNPLTNEVDSPIVIKATVEAQKPTTEKLGLVTWSNYNEPPVTPAVAAINNTTLKEDTWSPATPLGGWVLIPTVTPGLDNITGPTMLPSNTIPPPKKPIVVATKPTNLTQQSTSQQPILNATTVTTSKPEVTKPVFTLEVSTKQDNESLSENSTATPLDEQEFSTFMYVSSGPTEASSPANGSSVLNITTSSTVLSFNGSALNGTTTQIPIADNNTASATEATVNGTVSPDDALSTEKSTVSPIEGITSTASPIASPDSLNMSDFTDVCGRRLWPEARIVGGARSSFGRWPWQISLRQWRTSTYLHKCGAALLNENWAITAAHCVDSVPPSDLLLRLGEHDLASEEEPYGFQERRVQIVASHPQFDPRTFEYDLALLRFYEPVTFQPNILPVCVPTDDNGFIGETAYVTGWGRLYEDGPLPSVLQEVSVPVIENAACESMYRNAGYIEHIPNIFICAGWKKGGFDSCEGDSGGPMVLQRSADKRFLLAGVISWGIGCAEPNQPGVYTRISQFRHWINQILQF